MIAQDQAEVVAFLSAPHARGADKVEIIETHISWIFLSGDGAYKIKRAVKLPYVDFSTAELRLAACEKEVALNSVTAPGLYVGVRRIMRGRDGRLAHDQGEELVEAVIEMVQFDQEALFDRMAVGGKLDAELMARTAHMIARFHGVAQIFHQGRGSENIAAVLRVNAAGFATSRLFDPVELAEFERAFERNLAAIHRCSMRVKSPAGSGDATVTCICAISACCKANRGCSTASSSTTRLQPSIRSMISRSCSWIFGIAAFRSLPTWS